MLSGFNNTTYLKLTLKEIKVQKQLFVFSVELGDESIVPTCLNQKDLPLSYKYYSPVISIIEELCQDNKRNLYIDRNN